jgi:uncharacterized membrane protein SpoIIM required for sporulation
MDVERFVRQRSQTWESLSALVDQAGGKAERLGPAELLRLGRLYRAAAADLAIARRRYTSEPIVRSLEMLVGRARPLVYGSVAERGTITRFFARDYWVRIREGGKTLAAATFLLFVPALVAALWGALDPEHASAFMPGVFESLGERETGTDLGIAPAEQAALSSFIFTNNIRVTLLAFALGITFGLGTAFVLISNGILLGVLGGLATAAGNGDVFIEYVVAHGVLELSCIVVAGGAGLRLGWAIVDPGYRRRSEALRTEGRAAVETVLGTAPWLVLAGLVEGFITPEGLGLGPMLVIGFLLGAIYWALVIWRGKPDTPDDVSSEQRAGLRPEIRSDARSA